MYNPLSCGLNIRGTGYDPMMIVNHKGCFDTWERQMMLRKESEVPDCMVPVETGDRVVETLALTLSRDPEARWSTVSMDPISLNKSCGSNDGHACTLREYADAEGKTEKSADFVTTRYVASKACVGKIRAPRGTTTEARLSEEAQMAAFSIARDEMRLRQRVSDSVGGTGQPVFVISGDFNPSTDTHVNVSTTGMGVSFFRDEDLKVAAADGEAGGAVQRLMRELQSMETFESSPAPAPDDIKPACQVYNTSMFMGMCRGGAQVELQKLYATFAEEGCPSGTADDDEILNSYVRKTHPSGTVLPGEKERLAGTAEYKSFRAMCRNQTVIDGAMGRLAEFGSRARECSLDALQKSTASCVQRIDEDAYTSQDYACLVDFAFQRVTENATCLYTFLTPEEQSLTKDEIARRAQDEIACKAQVVENILADLEGNKERKRCAYIVKRELGKEKAS